MPDPISGAGFLQLLAIFDRVRSSVRWASGVFRAKKRNAVEVLDKQLKWETPIRQELYKDRNKPDSFEVVIHDMDRFFEYPNEKESALSRISESLFGGRISAYFKRDLVGTSSVEFTLLLGWFSLEKTPNDEWVLTKGFGDDALTVGLVAYIPLEYIHEIRWDGDEYYNQPHIYCFFGNKGMPYRSMAYCLVKDRTGALPFYQEVETYDSISKRTKWHQPYLDGAF